MLDFPFTNKVISAEGLPRHQEASLSPVNPAYKNVLVIHFFILLLTTGGLIGGLSYAIKEFRPYFWWIIAAYLFLMFVRLFLILISFSRRAFAVREKDLMYQRGILSTRLTIIPYKNVQHVSINEGLIPRIFGLAQLQVYTAGNQAGDLKLSGLKREDALRIKSQIMDRLALTE